MLNISDDLSLSNTKCLWLQLLCVLNDLPDSLIRRFFKVAATLEVHRASELLREELEDLRRIFPDSLHLLAQCALLEYHLRGRPIVSQITKLQTLRLTVSLDFEAAETLLDRLHDRAPHRTSELDTYSNILYVMANRTKLSRLAHHFIRVAPHRPETCCLAGERHASSGDELR